MRLPLATDIESRDGNLNEDQIAVNALSETDGQSSALIKRPGCRLLGGVAAARVQFSSHMSSGNMLAVLGDQLIELSVFPSVVALETQALHPITAALPFSGQIGGVEILLKNGQEAWVYT